MGQEAIALEPLLVSRRTAAMLLGVHPKTVLELERRGVVKRVHLTSSERGHARYRLDDIRRLAQVTGTALEPGS